jgi:hypothetical protein
MGQIEVYNYLKKMRLTGDHKYFSVREVEKGLKQQGYSNGVLDTVRGSLIKLEYWGYVETIMTGEIRNWKRLFRIKEKELKEEPSKC